MITLRLRLIEAGLTVRTLSLSAKTVIVTRLTVSSGGSIERPTLVSVENIIGRINDVGFELASSAEVNKIAKHVNTYYLPIPRASWSDILIDVRVVPILEENVELYPMIKVIRRTVIEISQERRSDEPEVTPMIEESVKSKPGLMEKVRAFLQKTAIPRLIDTFVGLTIDLVIKSILIGIFHINPMYL